MADEMIITVGTDGEVEVKVRGVKGKRCREVSKAITAALGEVTSSVETEEMQQTEVRNVEQHRHRA